MSSQNPDRTDPNALEKALEEKNVVRTFDQPGLVRTIAASPPSTTSVETEAIVIDRRVRRCRARARSSRVVR